MEQEGIYYYFKHEDGKHTLVLADSSSKHKPVAGCEKLPFIAAGERLRQRHRTTSSSWDFVTRGPAGRLRA